MSTVPSTADDLDLATGIVSLPAEKVQRILSGLTQEMIVEHHAPGMFEVTSVPDGDEKEGSQYTVDLYAPACTCRDFEYRSHVVGPCKHIYRCAAEYPDVVIKECARR